MTGSEVHDVSTGLRVYTAGTAPVVQGSELTDVVTGVIGSVSAGAFTNNVFERVSTPFSLTVTGGLPLFRDNTANGRYGTSDGEQNHCAQLGVTLTTDVTLLGDAGMPFCLSGSVGDGATLTVEAGAIVKMSSTLTVEAGGALAVEGTAAEPVVFTSYRDDAAGGDTNGDGAATEPVAGDWQLLRFLTGSTARLSHAVVRYGGRNWGSRYNSDPEDYTMVLAAEGSDVEIEDSELAHANYTAVRISGEPDNFRLRDSNLFRLSTGVDNRSDVRVRADNNWWWDSGGPYVPDPDPTDDVVQGNPDGVVYFNGDVDYSPWHSSPQSVNNVPVTYITGGPARISDGTATFLWESVDPVTDYSRSALLAVVEYEWEMSDGQSGTTQETSRSFSDLAPGTYTFKVRAMDDDGGRGYWASRTFSVSDIVRQPSVTLAQSEIGLGGTVSFTGRGFTPGGEILIGVAGPGGLQTDLATASSSGTFRLSVPLGSQTVSGRHTFVAIDRTTSVAAPSQSFSVVEPSGPNAGIVITGVAIEIDRSGASSARTPRSASAANMSSPGGAFANISFSDILPQYGTHPVSDSNPTHQEYRYIAEHSTDGGANWIRSPIISAGTTERAARGNFETRASLTADASYLVRVVDLQDETRKSASEAVVVADESAEEIDAVLEWDYSYAYPERSRPLNGVAADGESRLYVRVWDRFRTNGTTVSSVSVSLSHADGEGEQSARALGRIVHAEQAPGYNYEANTGNDGGVPMTTPTPETPGDFMFWFVSPEDFARSKDLDGTRGSRQVVLMIRATLSDGSTSEVQRLVRVVRPPVMLVHGLGDSSTGWDSFRLRDIDGTNSRAFCDDKRFVVCDEPNLQDNQGHFQINSDALIGSYNVGLLSQYIRRMREAGYASNQVDTA